MKPLLLTALVLLPFAADAADTPSRWGGMFGFGSSKQKGEQISSDLFPAGTQSASPTPPVASPVTTTTDESIFRGGEPQKVEPVSYAIENGQKVEKEVEKKKSSIFSFGKRDESGAAENQVLAPVPTATPATTIPATPIVAVPNQVPVQATPTAVLTDSPTPIPTAAPVAPPAAGEAKESRFGWIPFLSKKKEEAPVPAFANTTPAPAAPMVASEISPPAATPAATTPPAAVKETAKPAAPAGGTGVASFEVPKKTGQEVEKPKPEGGGGLLAPIAKIRPPKKEIDLTNAETIIQNGEIVAPTESNFETAPTPATSTERRPPAVVNGVKTYSSWDDVEGRSTSAADRIINQIR